MNNSGLIWSSWMTILQLIKVTSPGNGCWRLCTSNETARLESLLTTCGIMWAAAKKLETLHSRISMTRGLPFKKSGKSCLSRQLVDLWTAWEVVVRLHLMLKGTRRVIENIDNFCCGVPTILIKFCFSELFDMRKSPFNLNVLLLWYNITFYISHKCHLKYPELVSSVRFMISRFSLPMRERPHVKTIFLRSASWFISVF